MTRKVQLCGRQIDRPGHICAFFDSREQEYGTIIPFLKDGLAQNEEIVNVVDTVRLQDHIQRLDAGEVRGEGRLSLATSEDAYLPGGRFDMNRMVNFVSRRAEEAARRGHRLRTAGWMDWIHRDAPGTEKAFEYEARMNLLFPKHDSTFMCIYDLSKLNGQMVVDIMSTHPWVVLNGDVRENSFYVPPDIYLSALVARKESAAPRSA